ncbi:MAG: 2-aminobenzoate-CoA ligase, partial [Phototrophicales bacterium]
GIGMDDVCIGTPPLAFTYGLGGILLFPLRVGGASVLLDKFTPESMIHAIHDFRATMTWTSPFFYRQMAALIMQGKGVPMPTLRKSISAGEALPISTRTAWREATGIEIIDGIGATEMLHIFISHTESEARPGATGKPVPGYRACVIDDAGSPLPPGQIGRLAVKGPTGCRYLADDRQRSYVQNGWNITGDAYLVDEDGYFHYQARTDDMIITTGYNVAAPEVEDALLLHPAVAECAVVGAPDEERGTIIKAFVVLRPGYTGDETMVKTLQDHVKETIAPYKYPRAVAFMDSLPRTETGKLQRFKLRQMEMARG